MSYHQLLITEVEHEMTATRKMLARMPADNWDFKPHDKSMPLGALANHIVNIVEWGVLALEKDRCDLPPDYKAFEAKSPEGLNKQFAEYAARLQQLVKEIDETKIVDPWTLSFAGKEMFTLPRLQVVRQWSINHLVHHRAQLGVYLRLLEIPVPATYGPSADEAVALL
jgi:uncharacterized damage-inducible protein DinB